MPGTKRRPRDGRLGGYVVYFRWQPGGRRLMHGRCERVLVRG